MSGDTLRYLISPIAGITTLTGEGLQAVGGLAGEAMDFVGLREPSSPPQASTDKQRGGLQPPPTTSATSPEVQAAAAAQQVKGKRKRRASTILTSYTDKEDSLLGSGVGKKKLGS